MNKQIVLQWLQSYREEAKNWCHGKMWILYAIWQPYFLYILVMHIIEPVKYASWFDGLNLGIHELGHFVFAAFGDFMTYAGGSILQCLVPVLSVVMFLRQRHYYGPGVMGVWLSTNLFGVATYMADARARQLTLVAPGVGVIPAGEAGTNHDWWQIFHRLGLLQWDTTIAFLTRLFAMIVMVASLIYMGWLCYHMFLLRNQPIARRKPRS